MASDAPKLTKSHRPIVYPSTFNHSKQELVDSTEQLKKKKMLFIKIIDLYSAVIGRNFRDRLLLFATYNKD